MTTEIITRKKLIASDGMVLTNGEIYGKVIFLASDSDETIWREVTEAEYEQHLADEEEKYRPKLNDDLLA